MESKSVLDFCFVLLISVVFFFFKDEVCVMIQFAGLSIFTVVENIHLVTSWWSSG